MIKATIEENNLVDLNLIRGGKPELIGKEPPITNWLLDLSEGTIFLCKSKRTPQQINNPFELEFHLEAKFYCEKTKEWAVRLYSNLNDEARSWVDPVRFVSMHDLAGVLYVPGNPAE